jgi:hypothetical protein
MVELWWSGFQGIIPSVALNMENSNTYGVFLKKNNGMIQILQKIAAFWKKTPISSQFLGRKYLKYPNNGPRWVQFRGEQEGVQLHVSGHDLRVEAEVGAELSDRWKLSVRIRPGEDIKIFQIFSPKISLLLYNYV